MTSVPLPAHAKGSPAPAPAQPQAQPAPAAARRKSSSTPSAPALPPAAAPEPRVKLSSTALLVSFVFLAALGAVFHHWFYVQNFQAMTSEDWQHAYFVPIVSLYLLWQRRVELARHAPRVFWPGMLVVVLGVNAYLFFQLNRAFANHMAQGWSLVLTIYGLVLLTLGPALARRLLMPIAYLLFAVTISEAVMRNITFALQLLASEGSWLLLNVMGFSTDLAGNVLKVHTDQGVIPLNVAEACSGMRMVIAFLALGVAVALVATRSWWQRTALVLLAAPVALLMNVVRVAALGVLSVEVDPEMAKGDAHMLVGTVLLVPAFFLYLGIVWALNKAVRDDDRPPPAPAPARFWTPGPPRWRALLRPAVASPLALLVLVAATLPAAVAMMGIHLKKLPIVAPGERMVRAIPAQTESWTRLGEDIQESKESLDELGTENYLTRTYLRAPRPAASPADGAAARTESAPRRPDVLGLHLAYYTGMIDTVPHVPERCMVGGGWSITGATRVVPMTLDRARGGGWIVDGSASAPGARSVYLARTSLEHSDKPGVRVRLPRNIDDLALRVTEFNDPQSGRTLLAGYFFIANGQVASSAEEVRLLAFDLRDDYAYYLKVQFSSDQVSTPEELAALASDLLSELLPELMRCVPDWVEVEAGRYPADHPRGPRPAPAVPKGTSLGAVRTSAPSLAGAPAHEGGAKSLAHAPTSGN